MQTLIVLTNDATSLDGLELSVCAPDELNRFGESGWAVHRNRNDGTLAYVRILRFDDVQSQYEPDEVLPLMLGKNTRGFLIEFNDLALLKDVMPSLVDRDDVAVDDDHGMVVRGADFVRGLRVQDALPWLLPDYAS